MMDPSIGWFQPEHDGPAIDMWKRIWSEYNEKTQDNNCYKCVTNNYKSYTLKYNPNSTYNLTNTPELVQKYNGTPWRSLRNFHERGIDGLHQEIEEFFTYMKPTATEERMRSEVLMRITKIIETIWPKSVVECFGSYKTGTYLPTSDIDIVVMGRFNYMPLIELQNHLLSNGFCQPSDIQVLDRASIPIIKMIDTLTGLTINISVNLPEVFKSVKLINAFIEEFPNLKKIVYIIKQFLLQRDLNEVFRGGISSYSVILMVISFFQTNADTHEEPQKANLGKLLMRFLEFYGKTLNYEKVGIRIKDGGRFLPKEELFKNMKQSLHAPALLCIEDPLNPTNNVSKNSYAVNKVKDAFEYAFDILFRAVGPLSSTVDHTQSILGRIIRVTDSAIDKRAAMTHQFINLGYNPNLWYYSHNYNRRYPMDWRDFSYNNNVRRNTHRYHQSKHNSQQNRNNQTNPNFHPNRDFQLNRNFQSNRNFQQKWNSRQSRGNQTNRNLQPNPNSQPIRNPSVVRN